MKNIVLFLVFGIIAMPFSPVVGMASIVVALIMAAIWIAASAGIIVVGLLDALIFWRGPDRTLN